MYSVIVDVFPVSLSVSHEFSLEVDEKARFLHCSELLYEERDSVLLPHSLQFLPGILDERDLFHPEVS